MKEYGDEISEARTLYKNIREERGMTTKEKMEIFEYIQPSIDELTREAWHNDIYVGIDIDVEKIMFELKNIKKTITKEVLKDMREINRIAGK